MHYDYDKKEHKKRTIVMINAQTTSLDSGFGILRSQLIRILIFGGLKPVIFSPPLKIEALRSP